MNTCNPYKAADIRSSCTCSIVVLGCLPPFSVPRAAVTVRPLFIVVCIPLPVISPQEFVDGAVVPKE